MPKFHITINRQRYAVDVPAHKPLLWVLRDELGLTGTKYGCGIGQCGACTVHLNGRAVPSCSVAVGAAAGAASAVTTIEGLARDDGDHPVLRAWAAENVPQCGYCQSGQIMAAVALLARSPQPSEAEITEAMRPNLCRCGTYYRIRKAIRRAIRATE